ncbi:MAG: ligand-binding sensor domain-containing protein [Bacteroidia bacterium]
MSKAALTFFFGLLTILSMLTPSGAQSLDGGRFSENAEWFRTRDGLPHNTVLSLHQDRQGYLWIGTYNGVCRYDGFEFRTFQRELNLLGIDLPQAVETIFEDGTGKIWMGSRGGLIACFDPITGKWQAYNTKNTVITAMWCFYEDHTNGIWVGTRDGYLGRLDSSVNEFVFKKVQPTDIHGIVEYGSSQLLLVGPEPSLYSIKDQQCRPINRLAAMGNARLRVLNRQEQLIVLEGPEIKQVSPGNSDIVRRRLPVIPDHHTILGKAFNPDDYLVFFRNKVLIGKLELGIIDSFQLGSAENWRWETNAVLLDRTNILWVATHSGLLKIDRNKSIFKSFFSGTGTDSIRKYSRSVFYSDPYVWLGFKKATSIFFRPEIHFDQVEFKTTCFLEENGRPLNVPTTNTFLKCRNGKLFSGSLEGLALFNPKKKCFEILDPEEFSLCEKDLMEIWALYEDTDGIIWVGTGKNGLWCIDLKEKKAAHLNRFAVAEISGDPLAIWCIYEDHSKTIWLGTNQGLFSIRSGEKIQAKNFRKRHVFGGDSLNGKHIWNLYEDSRRQLWIGTTDNGINILNPQRSSIRYFNILNGLRSNTISGIIEDSFGNIWVSTLDGLVRIARGESFLQVFTEEDGLISNDFNFKDVTADPQGRLYFGTKMGVVVFDPTLFSPPSDELSSPIISEFTVLGEDLEQLLRSDGLLELAHDQNFFQFRFSALHFKNPSRHKFRYRLKGLEEKWNVATVKDPYAKYTHVPPGEYLLQVEASIDGIHWLPRRLERNIVLHPAVWQTLWFRIGIVILLGFTIVFFMYLRFKGAIRREKDRTRFTRKLAELELTALQAQMNPHFIFNSINSIQHYILNHDDLAANDYLTRFARLMRLFLHSSKQKYLPLKVELEILRNYVALESLRFEEKFEYTIVVGTDVPDWIKIPTMILQPFVENSINHGLLPKNETGRLLLEFKREGNTLLCRVDDNGIGREKAMLMRQSIGEHQSMGMSLIQERLKIYESMDERKIELRVEDKRTKSGESLGTLVELRINVIHWNNESDNH